MKKGLTIFFQVITILIGVSAFIFLLWEPLVEGRNVNSTLFEIYFKDPFLACVYLAAILFFAALYQTYKILGYIRRGQTFSLEIKKILQSIKYCSIILIFLTLIAEVYLFVFQRSKDDIAGGVFMGFLMIVIFAIIGSMTSVYKKFFQI